MVHEYQTWLFDLDQCSQENSLLTIITYKLWSTYYQDFISYWVLGVYIIYVLCFHLHIFQSHHFQRNYFWLTIYYTWISQCSWCLYYVTIDHIPTLHHKHIHLNVKYYTTTYLLISIEGGSLLLLYSKHNLYIIYFLLQFIMTFLYIFLQIYQLGFFHFFCQINAKLKEFCVIEVVHDWYSCVPLVESESYLQIKGRLSIFYFNNKYVRFCEL